MLQCLIKVSAGVCQHLSTYHRRLMREIFRFAHFPFSLFHSPAYELQGRVSAPTFLRWASRVLQYNGRQESCHWHWNWSTMIGSSWTLGSPRTIPKRYSMWNTHRARHDTECAFSSPTHYRINLSPFTKDFRVCGAIIERCRICLGWQKCDLLSLDRNLQPCKYWLFVLNSCCECHR